MSCSQQIAKPQARRGRSSEMSIWRPVTTPTPWCKPRPMRLPAPKTSKSRRSSANSQTRSLAGEVQIARSLKSEGRIPVNPHRPEPQTPDPPLQQTAAWSMTGTARIHGPRAPNRRSRNWGGREMSA